MAAADKAMALGTVSTPRCRRACSAGADPGPSVMVGAPLCGISLLYHQYFKVQLVSYG